MCITLIIPFAWFTSLSLCNIVLSALFGSPVSLFVYAQGSHYYISRHWRSSCRCTKPSVLFLPKTGQPAWVFVGIPMGSQISTIEFCFGSLNTRVMFQDRIYNSGDRSDRDQCNLRIVYGVVSAKYA